MKRVRLDLELLTPSFCTGPARRPEWRGPSIRGQLRWWLRALTGGRLDGDLTQVRTAERGLFGSTGRRSPVTVRVTRRGGPLAGRGETYVRRYDSEQLARIWRRGNEPDPTPRLRLRGDVRANPIAYLGYGRLEHTGQPVHDHLPARDRARLELVAQTGADLALLADVVWLWTHLGGLGGRSRRGFGALTSKPVPGTGGELPAAWRPAASVDALTRELKRRLEGVTAEGLPEWSHFSSGASISVSQRGYDSWEGALAAAGAWMIAYRRRYGAPNDERPAIAKRDYDWIFGGGTPGGVPDRAGFGLPLPFVRSGPKVKKIVSWKGRSAGDRRRASPLLLTLCHLDGRFHSVWTHLPARLVPAGKEVGVRNQLAPGGWQIRQPATARQTGIVDEFLAELAARDLARRLWP